MLRNLILAVFFFSTSLCFAQDFPRPGKEHERLKEMVGEWDAVMKMAGQESKAKATYRSILGGMYVESDFEGDLGGLKFQGRGLDGYNLKTKKYVGVWTDSLESAPMFMEGDYDPDSKILVMTGESTDPSGKPQKFKTKTKFKDKDHFIFEMYMVPPDGKEQQAFTIEYTRRK